MGKNRGIEVRYLSNLNGLVTFLELSPGEIREMVTRCPFPAGHTLKNCNLTPKQAADWFEGAMKQAIIPKT